MAHGAWASPLRNAHEQRKPLWIGERFEKLWREQFRKAAAARRLL